MTRGHAFLVPTEGFILIVNSLSRQVVPGIYSYSLGVCWITRSKIKKHCISLYHLTNHVEVPVLIRLLHTKLVCMMTHAQLKN